MRSIKFYLVLALAVTFLAGLATGRLNFGRTEEPRKLRGMGSHIVEQLKLTGDQRQKVLDIWSKAYNDAPPPPFKEFRELDQQEDAQIDALLTTEQREQISKIKADCDARKAEMNAPAVILFRKAQQDTRELLSPQQQTEFDKMIADKMPRFRGRGHGGPPPTPTN